MCLRPSCVVPPSPALSDFSRVCGLHGCQSYWLILVRVSVSGANSGAKDMPADDDLEKANGIIKSMCKGLLQDGIPSVICGDVLLSNGCRLLLRAVEKHSVIDSLRKYIKKVDGMTPEQLVQLRSE